MRGNIRQVVRATLGKIYDMHGHSYAWSRFKTEPFRIRKRRKKKKGAETKKSVGPDEEIGLLGSMVEFPNIEEQQ
jgi:hypothetical protein